MGISIKAFVAQSMNKVIGFSDQCVSAFWEFNRLVNKSEAYSAVGAYNLWAGDGRGYFWDSYDRVAENFIYGDWPIWHGYRGAYQNGGDGHVAMWLGPAEAGYGWFASQNPGPLQTVKLSLDGVMGALRARGVESGLNIPTGPGLMNLQTVQEGYVRTGAGTGFPTAPGWPEAMKGNQTVAARGYVIGQDPYKDGRNRWVETRSGFYMHEGAFGGNLGTIPKLN